MVDIDRNRVFSNLGLFALEEGDKIHITPFNKPQAENAYLTFDKDLITFHPMKIHRAGQNTEKMILGFVDLLKAEKE